MSPAGLAAGLWQKYESKCSAGRSSLHVCMSRAISTWLWTTAAQFSFHTEWFPSFLKEESKLPRRAPTEGFLPPLAAAWCCWHGRQHGPLFWNDKKKSLKSHYKILSTSTSTLLAFEWNFFISETSQLNDFFMYSAQKKNWISLDWLSLMSEYVSCT